MRKTVEKRVLKRKVIDQPLTFDISEPDSWVFSNVRIASLGLNMSSGGIGISTDRQLQRNDIVKIILPIDADIKLPIFSEVVWVKASKGKCWAGLQFLG